MIKLKDIILEIKKGTKRPVVPIFPISRMEEDEAFQFIKQVVFPDWIKQNPSIYLNCTDNKDELDLGYINWMNKNLKKGKIYRQQGKIIGVMFINNSNPTKSYWFLVKKDKNGKLIVKNQRGDIWDVALRKQTTKRYD